MPSPIVEPIAAPIGAFTPPAAAPSAPPPSAPSPLPITPKAARVLFGAQISLLVGVVGAGVSLVIGVLWGAVAGYVGGRLDSFLMRIVDVLYSLPSIIFVIVLVTTLGKYPDQPDHPQEAAPDEAFFAERQRA